jgi:PRA1 family protein 1
VPLAVPAFRLFLSRLSETTRPSLTDRKLWVELLDRSVFSQSDSFSDTTGWLHHNIGYFCVNYAVVVAFSLAASLLTHPFSLLVLLNILGVWYFLYVFRASDQPVVLFSRTFTDRETLLNLVVVFVLVFFLPSVASLIISDLLVGGAARRILPVEGPLPRRSERCIQWQHHQQQVALLPCAAWIWGLTTSAKFLYLG